jgi:hypothetical protein
MSENDNNSDVDNNQNNDQSNSKETKPPSIFNEMKEALKIAKEMQGKK